jgi:hypothetical protein
MKPPCLVHDNLSDRREILELLKRLRPSQRVALLDWACSTATLPNSTTRPGVGRKTKGSALEIFFDLWMLSVSFDFDLDAALAKLVSMVREPAKRRRVYVDLLPAPVPRREQ